MTLFNPKIAFILLSVLSLQSCVENTDSTRTETADTTATEIDPNKSNIVSVGEAIFSIPSPVQTALLIESSGAGYDPSLPNSVQNLNNYISDFDKGLLMGVYGADLAYNAIFEKNQEAISYLGAVEKLASDLDLENAVDRSIIKRFSQNLNNRDSMLVLSSTFFRASDAYLKENERTELAALILIGGWAEGMFLAYNSVESNGEVAERIAEQKMTIDNMVTLLGSLEPGDQLTELTDQLTELQAEFNNINATYEYQRPEVDADNKTTTLKSKTSYEISDEQFKVIGSKIESIRNTIVG